VCVGVRVARYSKVTILGSLQLVSVRGQIEGKSKFAMQLEWRSTFSSRLWSYLGGVPGGVFLGSGPPLALPRAPNTRQTNRPSDFPRGV
jgi:hypothetical protein